jgi:hypothetical protein
VLGQSHRGVVAGRQQQAVEQSLEPHLAVDGQEPHLGSVGLHRLAGDDDRIVGTGAVGHQDRGHHLREAGDRLATGRPPAPQHPSGVELEQQSTARRPLEANVDLDRRRRQPVRRGLSRRRFGRLRGVGHPPLGGCETAALPPHQQRRGRQQQGQREERDADRSG